MSTVSHFNIKIAVDSKTGETSVVGFSKKAKDSLGDIEKQAQKTGMGLGNLMGKFAGLAAAVGVAGLAGAMVKGAAELESYNVQFEVLTGSAEKGKKLFDDIRTMGAATPFNTADLAASANTMLANNIALEKIMPNMDMLSNVAAGSADKLGRLTTAFSRIQSNGKLMGEELNTMIDVGFNPLTIISEQTGKSMAQLRKDMESGAISADQVTEAFKIATSEGGKFYQMNEKMSKTFSGMVSTLQDTIGALLAEAGAPLLELLKELMPVITPIVQQLAGALKPIIDALVKSIKTLLPPFMALVDKVFKALSPILDLIVRSMDKLTPIFAKLITAASKLLDAMMPMVDMFVELAEDQLDQLIELLDAVLTLFIALSPAITLVAQVTATLIGTGLSFMNAVVTPIIDAIKFIIEKGAEAANWVASIFGGSKQGKGASAQSASGGQSLSGAGADASVTLGEDGKPKPTGGAGGSKLVPGSIPYMEAQLKKLEELRGKTEAGSAAWANLTLRIAAAQAELDVFTRIAQDLTGTGPAAKGMSPFEKLGNDAEILTNTVAPAIDATVSIVDKLADSYENVAIVAGNVAGALGNIFAENFEVMKGIAVAETIISTSAAIMRTLRDGGAWALPIALSVGALGATQIAKILATKPGSSGGGSQSISGLAQSGSAPSGPSAVPRRLALSGASGSMPTEIKLRAEGADLVGVMHVNTRNMELAGV